VCARVRLCAYLLCLYVYICLCAWFELKLLYLSNFQCGDSRVHRGAFYPPSVPFSAFVGTQVPKLYPFR